MTTALGSGASPQARRQVRRSPVEHLAPEPEPGPAGKQTIERAERDGAELSDGAPLHATETNTPDCHDGLAVKRTTLTRHASAEMATAGLQRLDATLSDLVAYGELTYSCKLPDKGPAAVEVAALIKELRAMGWIPKIVASRKPVTV